MLEHGSLAYSAEGRSWSWYRAWCGTLAAWGLGLALAFAHWLRTLAVARAWWECEVLSMCVRAGPERAPGAAGGSGINHNVFDWRSYILYIIF